MFCGKCGSNVPDGIKFCPNCGNPIEVAEPSVESEAPDQVVDSAAPSQPVANQIPAYAPVQNAAPKKAKKVKKAPIIIGVILAFVLVVGIVGLVCWQGIARAVMGESGYYLWREAKTLDTVFVVDGMDKLDKNKEVSAKSNVKVSLDGDDSEIEEYNRLLESVSADVDFSYSADKQKAVAVFGIVAADKTEAEANISFEQGKLGISIPEMTDDDLYIDLGMDDDRVELDYATIGKELLEIYKQIEKDHIATNTEVTKKEVNGKKCRVVTVTVDGDEAADLIVDLLTAIKDDEELMKALEPALKAALNSAEKVYDEDITYEDFMDELDEHFDDLIDEIKWNLEDEDIVLEIGYAADSKGNVLNRTIKLTEDDDDWFDVVIDTNVKGKEKTLDFKLEIPDEDYVLEFNVVRTDSKDGANFDIKGKTVESWDNGDYGANFEGKFENIKVENINGVNVLLGKIDVEVVPVYDSHEEDDDSVTVSVLLEDNGTYNLAVDVGVDDGEFICKVEIASTLYSKADFSKFKEPDKNGTDDFEEFYFGIEENLQDLLLKVIKDVDPELYEQIERNSSAKICMTNVRIITGNLSSYIMLSDTTIDLTKIKSPNIYSSFSGFSSLFSGAKIPYCTAGGKSVPYTLVVNGPLSFDVICNNPDCPNYHKTY